MYRHLPSLDNLKGFEAAARHLSFTKAANELFLTQSAISRQIQSLEEQLGLKLFRRGIRSLRLTPEGQLLYKETVESLNRLNQLCQNLKARRKRPKVMVSASISFASLWLLPRIAGFQECNPGMDVLISADNRLVDLEREDIDIALRFIPLELAPAQGEMLFEEVIFPVISPSLKESLPEELNTASFAEVNLLVFAGAVETPWLAWEPWLADMGLKDAKPRAILQFNQYDQMIRAAEDGRGLALGRSPLLDGALKAGRLLPLNDMRKKVVSRAYFMVMNSSSPRPEVEAFATWLRQEARFNPHPSPPPPAGPGF